MIKLIRHRWGVSDPLGALPRIKSQGYRGIEVGVLLLPDPLRLVESIHAHGFEFIPQIFTAEFEPVDEVSRHVDSFAQQLEAVAAFDPVMVVCHGGRGALSAEAAGEFYGRVLEISREFPFPVAHETHRGATFTIHGTAPRC